MKKSLFLFVLVFTSVLAFADTKVYLGGCNFSEYFSKSTDNTKGKGYGLDKEYGFNAKIKSSYNYIEENGSLVINNKYLYINNELRLKWNVFYISTTFDFSCQNFEYCLSKYVDISLGLNFTKDVFDWLSVGGDFKIGYVPLNTIYDFDNGKSLVTSLKLNIDILDYVSFYCGIESIQQRCYYIIFNQFTVKNVIGIKGEYFWNSFGVYGSFDYYCLHPVNQYNEQCTNSNQNRINISFGVAFNM